MADSGRSIPKKCIALTDGFDRVFNAVNANLDQLYDDLDAAEMNVIELELEQDQKGDGLDFRLIEARDQRSFALKMWDNAQRKAHQLFRTALVEQKLTTYIQDPETGDMVKLAASGWALPDWCSSSFISSNYVDPRDLDNPGPADATIRGVRQPVFFRTDEFNHWFTQEFGSGHRSGRPKGSGSFVTTDMPLIHEMRALMDSNKAKSIWDAARKVAPRAAGGGEESAKQKRLDNLYRTHFHV
jgi:hypothetical protein